MNLLNNIVDYWRQEMQYISSDTNIWIDFLTINRLYLPFKLPYTYLMNEDAISDELLSPTGLSQQLINFGLKATELSTEEFYLAEKLNQKYRKPSIYDCVALAIAKCRNITLLTGDGPLRKAAFQEGVKVLGTIGILDQLYQQELIPTEEYLNCLEDLERFNHFKVRLPSEELAMRIKKLKDATYT